MYEKLFFDDYIRMIQNKIGFVPRIVDELIIESNGTIKCRIGDVIITTSVVYSPIQR